MIPALSGRVCRIVARFFRANHRSKCVNKMRLHTRSTSRSAEALLRKEKVMVTIKVKDGTPEGAETLCMTCRWAHIVKGFRVSEKEIFCRYLTDDRFLEVEEDDAEIIPAAAVNVTDTEE